MNKDIPGSFDEFLAEFTASLKSTSGEGALRRINAERVLRLVLEEIVQQRQDLQIRVLEDSRIAGKKGVDILMQIDDYEIRLALLDTPLQVASIEKDALNRYRETFEDNPSTEYIILTWTTDDLKSQKLNLHIIEYLKVHPENISQFLSKVKPLQEVLGEILTSHMKMWESMVVPSETDTSTIMDVKNLFLEYIHIALHKERDRQYRNKERKMAATNMPQDREVSLLTNVLDEALQGMSSKNLAVQLSQLPRRGRK